MNFIKYVLDGMNQYLGGSGECISNLREKHGLNRGDITKWYKGKLQHIRDKSIGFTAV